MSWRPVRPLRAAIALLLLLGACSPAPAATRATSGPGGPTTSPASPPPSTVSRSPDPTDPPPGLADGGAAPSPAIVVDPIVAPWTRALDEIASGSRVSVAVGVAGRILYVHGGHTSRIPASAQKLLTSITALEVFGPSHRFPTVAASVRRPRNGVVHGDLWLVGGGDPELGPERIDALAAAVRREGIHRIAGEVAGDTAAFSRRWWAPGWVEGISRHYVTRPTALTFAGNGGTVAPELQAARSLVDALRRHGVVVDGTARIGEAPQRLRPLGRVRSATLGGLLARQNHGSLNLYAEILLRAIGARRGEPTTAGGADAVETAAGALGLEVRVRDGSGLSHGNAVSAVEITSMLLDAASSPWARSLERSLPAPGSGTLGARLAGIPVRAKTGTLFTVPCSALAGYVRGAGGRKIAFAVLSDGVAKGTSIGIEDAVVRVLASHTIA